MVWNISTVSHTSYAKDWLYLSLYFLSMHFRNWDIVWDRLISSLQSGGQRWKGHTEQRWVDFDAQHETEWQIITHGCWYSTASTLLLWSVCSLTSRCIVCETHRECVNRSRKLIQCWSCRYPPLGNSYTNQRIWGWDGGVGRRQDGQSQARTSRNRWRERWKERGGWTKLSMLEHSGLSAIWWRWSEVLKINNVLDMSAERFDHWVPNQGIHLRCRLNILGDFPKLQSILALLWQQSSEMTDKPEQDTIRSGLRA